MEILEYQWNCDVSKNSAENVLFLFFMSVEWCAILKYEVLPLTKDFLTVKLCFLSNCHRKSNFSIKQSTGQRACREKSWHLEYSHLDTQPESKNQIIEWLNRDMVLFGCAWSKHMFAVFSSSPSRSHSRHTGDFSICSLDLQSNYYYVRVIFL